MPNEKHPGLSDAKKKPQKRQQKLDKLQAALKANMQRRKQAQSGNS